MTYTFNPKDWISDSLENPLRISSSHAKYREWDLTPEQFSDMVEEFLPHRIVIRDHNIPFTLHNGQSILLSSSLARLERKQWCKKHCTDYWTDTFLLSKGDKPNSVSWRFRNINDALLFKLTVGEV